MCVSPGTNSNLVVLERAFPAGGKQGMWGIGSSLVSGAQNGSQAGVRAEASKVGKGHSRRWVVHR